MSTLDYDILIAGGGMVGAATAAALEGSGLNVAVLEGGPLPTMPQDEFDIRVSAIAPASRLLLEKLGAWQGIPSGRIADIEVMEVWDAEGSGHIRFDAADIGEPALAWLVENRAMQAALAARLQRLPNVRYLPDMRLHTVDIGQDRVDVSTESGEHFTGKLLIAADGAASKVRQLMAIESAGWDFKQKAIVANVRSDRPHRHVALQRFLSSGPVALLPLADKQLYSIVWSADTAEADRLMALDETTFAAALAEAIEHKAGQLELAGERAAFPLSLAHAESYVDHRLALVGDAAHRVHPLAGQGVNLGYADAEALAGVIRKAVAIRRDYGERYILEGYERARRTPNRVMLLAMDAFKRGFGSRHPAVVQFRNLGLDLADRLQPLKHFFMRRAMGGDR